MDSMDELALEELASLGLELRLGALSDRFECTEDTLSTHLGCKVDKQRDHMSPLALKRRRGSVYQSGLLVADMTSQKLHLLWLEKYCHLKAK